MTTNNPMEYSGTGQRPWFRHKPIVRTHCGGLIYSPQWLAGLRVSDLTDKQKEQIEGV